MRILLVDLRLLAETVAEHLAKTESKWMTIREKVQLHCSAVAMTTQVIDQI